MPSYLDQLLNQLSPREEDLGIHNHIASSEEPIDPLAGVSHRICAQEDWRHQASKALVGDGVLAETMLRMRGQKDAARNIEHSKVGEEEVRRAVSDLLHLGFTPSHVASLLAKRADFAAYQEAFIPNVISELSGVVGYSFIEPNHWNNCQTTYDKIRKEGKLQALSVKKIAACSDCSRCKGHTCSLFNRPIVGSAQDLKRVVAHAAHKIGKTAATKQLLASLHDNTLDSQMYGPPSNHHYGPLGGFTNIQKVEEKTISPSHIANAVTSTPIYTVYANLLPQYGKVATSTAVRKFIDGLKTAGTQVAIDMVDCRYLKGKLAVGNSIVGSSKCADCALRRDMHCGLTGGTLLAFPGMAKCKGKQASGPVQEGGDIAAAFDLQSQMDDIDTAGVKRDDVELSHGLDFA